MFGFKKATVSEDQVLEALRRVQDPDLHRDIVSLGFVKDVRIAGDAVSFTIELTTPACPVNWLPASTKSRLWSHFRYEMSYSFSNESSRSSR